MLEAKNLKRNLEKQAKVMEKLLESEKSLTSQVVSAPPLLILLGTKLLMATAPQAAFEKEIATYNKLIDEQKRKYTSVEFKAVEYNQQRARETVRADEVSRLSHPLHMKFT